MAASLFSRPDPFDCKKGDIGYYLEQFEHFLTLNSIEDDDKRVPMLITTIGQDAYKILKEICAPDDPKTKSFPQLETLLKEYFARRDFYQRNQGPKEPFPVFRAEVEKLCQKCNFGAFEKDALRDRLACGKRPPNEDPPKKTAAPPTQEKVTASEVKPAPPKPRTAPANPKSKASAPAPAVEAPGLLEKALGLVLGAAEVGQMVAPAKKGPPQHKCKICGHEHWEKDCPHKNASCHICDKKGHIASVCREKHKSQNAHQQQQKPVQVHVHVQQNTGVKNEK